MTITKVKTTTKNILDAKNKKKLDYKKLRVSDNYLYSSEEEPEKQGEKTIDLSEFNKQIIDEQIDLDKELFKEHFKFQRPSDMLMLLNKTKDKTKNDELVNAINSGLKDLKEEIKKISEAEKKLKTQNRQ